MNNISLAAKYLTRRKSRAFLILVVFLIINIMAFTIISIGDAANDALADLEQKPLDYFYLNSQYETDPDSVIVEGSSISYLSVPHLITNDVIGKIMRIRGIKTYAAHYSSLGGMISDVNGNPLEFVACQIPAEADDVASIKGVSDTGLFLGSRVNLAAGKHITPDSEREAMVNVRFAEKNGLNVGDQLVIKLPDHTTGIKVTLCGIYEIADEDETELSPSELSANVIYVDDDTALTLVDEKQGIISVKFFVDRPDQLADIFAQVQKLDLDWNKYELFNEEDVSLIDGDSVKAVSDQFSALTVVIFTAGFLVITLVLMLQTRMRVNEIAILLSLGHTKRSIILQHMIEATIPAGLSIAAAYFIGNGLMTSALFRGIQLSVNHIQMTTTAQIIAINLCLLIVSIGASSARLLCAPPREILGKNN